MESLSLSLTRFAGNDSNPLLPKALWISTSLSFACKASYIGPKQHGYMLPTIDDAFHQELMTATACAGDRDRNEKGVKFSIFNSCLLNSRDASKLDPTMQRTFTAL